MEKFMIITVKDLRKTYMTYKRGDKFLDVLKGLILPKKELVHALKGISFSIEKGELLGLLGPNGAGKSTTIKVLTGVLYPASGEVSVMGYTPWKQRRKYVRNIGALFGQKSQLIWDIPPLDAFRLNQAIYDIPEQVFKKRLN
jgi:ABC-2 type transport system ATP-binding protein